MFQRTHFRCCSSDAYGNTKAWSYLIRAEPRIAAQVPNAKIIIAGRGEDFTRYRQMMVHPDKFIVYNEYVSHERATELFRRASVVVLPYIDATQRR